MQYDSSCSVEHVLQRLDISHAHMVEDTVIVVYPTRNECMYQGCGSIFREWLLHGIHLPQMVKTLARQASDMGCKGQRTLSSNTLRQIASVKILMLMPSSVMVRSWSLDRWCGVPTHMNWVLSWFNFNRLAHIHRHMWPASAHYCLLPMGLHGHTAECRRHMSALWVHVTERLRWHQHSRRGNGQVNGDLIDCTPSMLTDCIRFHRKGLDLGKSLSLDIEWLL